MAKPLAAHRIKHDGKVYEKGDDLSGLPKEVIKRLILAQSVEIEQPSSKRKASEEDENEVDSSLLDPSYVIQQEQEEAAKAAGVKVDEPAPPADDNKDK